MPVSLARASRHIEHYRTVLRGIPKYWPDYIFHAAPIQTVLRILASSQLSCRTGLPAIDLDVANQGALQNNPAAHPYARFYFRPKTMYHIRTEGIKCRDHPHRQKFHMSVPVVLMFDASAVLTRADTGFTDRNFAIGGVAPSFDEAGFNRIAFDDVYHDASAPGPRGHEIRERRMAEIVVPNALPLNGFLRHVVCRTQYDAATLKYLLGANAAQWNNFIITEPMLNSIFLHWALYIKNMTPAPNGLFLTLKPPTDFHVSSCHIRFSDHPSGNVLWESNDFPVEARPQAIPIGNLANIRAIEITIDDVLAFCGPLNAVVSQVVGP